MENRVVFDVDAYAQRTLTGGCFICALQRGYPGLTDTIAGTAALGSPAPSA